MRLEGKVALITVAGRGFGRAIACAFCDEGASVLVNDRDEENALETVRLCGAKSVPAVADISILRNHESLIERATQQFGRLDILVNNAAIQFREPFLEAQVQSWDRTLDVNLKAPFFLAQRAAHRMLSQGGGGVILNIASIHDSVALQDRSIYAITKGGLQMMTRSLAFELAEYKIRVNAISPGAILTDMNRGVLSDDVRRDEVLKKIPLRRLGNPEDIAGAAVFLASAEASYINGATLYIDGGILTQ
jgi:glucose 1-dehydrogenase